jgi:hypothetical protein
LLGDLEVNLILGYLLEELVESVDEIVHLDRVRSTNCFDELAGVLIYFK